ncbi:Putative 3-hydroxyacyl-CoA dehydrogenase [Sarcoptes scabiei]|uniref:3-hydroxyacyl-CoA dehydrogenase n=1 Tax=Sarcoptes scabiei TaxID=52283 RepID=A0A834RHN0_SARSC|nr:Putative 3-hydroxyacyl-CoA dehydrogenase [Sarcoptes scabiei]
MRNLSSSSNLFLKSISSIVLKRSISTSIRLNRIENVLIIGSGLMGSGIAQSCASSGRFDSITLQDVSQTKLDDAKKESIKVTQTYENFKIFKINVKYLLFVAVQCDPNEAVNQISFVTEMKAKNDKNLLIIEAIPELLEQKQNLFKSLCTQYKGNDSVIYVTNTSSLPCHEIGVNVDCKDRFGGLHFFNPVPLMKLVEIVRTDNGTSEKTFKELEQFVKDIEKVGVACKDTPGFIVNRLLIPYMQEAIGMLERGDASAKDIDTAMKLGAGYPMGPFELLDYVGLDTNKFIVDAWIKRNDKSLNIYKSKTIDEMVSKGNLGKKTGKGFYDYSKK